MRQYAPYLLGFALPPIFFVWGYHVCLESPFALYTLAGISGLMVSTGLGYEVQRILSKHLWKS